MSGEKTEKDIYFSDRALKNELKLLIEVKMKIHLMRLRVLQDLI